MLIISISIVIILLIFIFNLHKKEKFVTDYIGCQDTTISGKTCQFWNDESIDSKYAVVGDHNYCRNLDGKVDSSGKKIIWCFTEDENTGWEQCCPIGYRYDEINKTCEKDNDNSQNNVNTSVTTSVTYNTDNNDKIYDDENFFIRPAKDENGNILETDKYYHGHLHTHDSEHD